MEACDERELADSLGLHPRALYRWRFENKALHRGELEMALTHTDLEISDVYPELEPAEGERAFCPSCLEDAPIDSAGACLWCECPTTRRPPGARGKIRDRHIRAFHRLHTDGGLTIRELSRRFWRRAGYSSAKSLEVTIRRGFMRLDLPVTNRRTNTAPPPERRCKGETPTGEQCTAWAMVGDEVCWMHHPDNHEQLSMQAKIANAKRHGLPLEMAA